MSEIIYRTNALKRSKKLSVLTLVLLLSGCGGGGSDDDIADVVVPLPVDPINQSPVLDAIESQVTFSETDKTITLNATDPDDNDLTYTATTSDSNVIIRLDGSELTLKPADDFYGTVLITATASDGSLSSSTEFTIRVLQISIPPILKFEGSPLPTPPSVTSL